MKPKSIPEFANRQTARQCRKLADQLLYLQDIGIDVDPKEVEALIRMSKRFFRRAQRSRKAADA